MISPGDLLSPAGDIASSLFPGEDADALETRLQGYIDEGVAAATDASVPGPDVDGATLSYAYYRAYNAVYVRMLADPSKQTIDQQGATESIWQQIQGFKALADEQWSYYLRFIPLASGTAPELLPPTSSVPAQFGF